MTVVLFCKYYLRPVNHLISIAAGFISFLLYCLLIRPREYIRVTGKDLNVFHLDKVQCLILVLQETGLKLLLIGVVKKSVNGMGPFLKKVILPHLLLNGLVLLSNCCFSLIFEQRCNIRRMAIHVSQYRVWS